MTEKKNIRKKRAQVLTTRKHNCYILKTPTICKTTSIIMSDKEREKRQYDCTNGIIHGGFAFNSMITCKPNCLIF